MSRYFSDELFHFVGSKAPLNHERNYEILKAVLSSGCVSHPPHNRGWGETSIHIDWNKSLATEELLVPTVVCFCDIPVEHLHFHLRKYGAFGLALGKSFLISCGTRPVMYIPFASGDHPSLFGKRLLQHIEAVYRGYREHIFDKAKLAKVRVTYHGARPRSAKEAISALDGLLAKDFLAFLKPFNAELSHDDADYYYAEREWRKLGNQVFNPEDVCRVLVAKGFVGRLEAEMPLYKSRIEVAPSP